MNKTKILERELKALGQYYRNDWSEFDGRTLKNQIEKIFDWFNKEDEIEFVEFSEQLSNQVVY